MYHDTISSSSVQVKVVYFLSRDGIERNRSFKYEECVCIGEMIRNICVNLGIDPDTEHGITKNVDVYNETISATSTPWSYNPNMDIGNIHVNGELRLRIFLST